METVTRTQSETLSVTCPICGRQHKYNFKAIIEEVIGIMHLMVARTESKSCSVVCPDKGSSFVVDVPITLWSGQSLRDLK